MQEGARAPGTVAPLEVSCEGGLNLGKRLQIEIISELIHFGCCSLLLVSSEHMPMFKPEKSVISDIFASDHSHHEVSLMPF